MSDLTKCKACGKEIAKTAPACPNCGVTYPGLKLECPKCGSQNFTTGRKKFGAGKAVVGTLVLGPIGLVGGLINRGKLELKCQSCNHKWKPKKGEF